MHVLRFIVISKDQGGGLNLFGVVYAAKTESTPLAYLLRCTSSLPALSTLFSSAFFRPRVNMKEVDFVHSASTELSTSPDGRPEPTAIKRLQVNIPASRQSGVLSKSVALLCQMSRRSGNNGPPPQVGGGADDRPRRQHM